jgi:signal transduction histidine kinase
VIEKRDIHYSPASFLKDRVLLIVLFVSFLLFLAAVLFVLQASPAGIYFIIVIALIGFAGYLIYDYVRQAPFWHSLEEASELLDRGTHFGDLVNNPITTPEHVAHEAALAVSRAGYDELNELRAQAKANSEYIELWVHEIKTPLSAAQLVAKRMTGPDALTLRRELERMDDMISQALFAARTDSLERDYLIREVKLLDIAREVSKSHMHYLTSLDVALEMRIDPALTVFADKIWLEFIVTQLLINAAKYDAKTVIFDAFILEDESSSSCTILEIKDDGCGVPASDVPRVFDRGFTGEVGRAHGSATGMGLYLVARMCMSMGLGIMFASEEGVGSRVQISFPHDRRRAALMRSTLQSRK